MQLLKTLNQRDNETKILIAEMSSQASVEEPTEDLSREDLALKIKKLDDEMNLKESNINTKLNRIKFKINLKKKI